MGTLDDGPYPASAVGRIWDGNYVSNDFQYVRPADAKALAAALNEALDDIPDYCVVPPDSNDNDLSDVQWFSGYGKTFLRRFAGFADRGGFTIS